MSVNLIALPTRLRRNLAQPLIVAHEARGQVLMDDMEQSRCFSRAFGAIKSSASSTQERKSKGELIQRQFARLDFREIKNIVNDGRRDSLLVRSVSTNSCWVGVSSVSKRRPAMPMTPFIGVRIS